MLEDIPKVISESIPENVLKIISVEGKDEREGREDLVMGCRMALIRVFLPCEKRGV